MSHCTHDHTHSPLHEGGCHCHDHCHSHGHEHSDGTHKPSFKAFIPDILSGLLLAATALLAHLGEISGALPLCLFLVSAIVTGLPIVIDGFGQWRRGDFMNEYTLMILAAICAFWIGEYPEGVAVLLFYSFGEKLQDRASEKARAHIRGLVDKMPKTVSVVNAEGKITEMQPKDVAEGSRIHVKPGMRVALDGVLEGEDAISFDTSAITGEAVPRTVSPGEAVQSGLIPVDREATLTTTCRLEDSSLSRILKTVEEAAEAKSHTETLIRRITRWYTPTVLVAAVLLYAAAWAVIPAAEFAWQTWFNRALILLVCACPCAMVISVPLSYFMSLGKASAHGVLVKGSTYFDAMCGIDTVLFDKTGTLTTGRFRIAGIYPDDGISEETLLSLAAGMEAQSAHPLAQSVKDAAAERGITAAAVDDVTTVRHGLTASHEGKTILAGSRRLLADNGLDVPQDDDTQTAGTEIHLALDGKYTGVIRLTDELKPTAAAAVRRLHCMGIRYIGILSGDRAAAVKQAAEAIGADICLAELSPEEKYGTMKQLKAEGRRIAYVGDGINDTPSLALADVGIAMGTAGTDAAMQHADAVIAGDDPARVPQLLHIARSARRVAITNVVFALAFKLIVMALGACGLASLWVAVFADTGVTLITIIYTLLALK